MSTTNGALRELLRQAEDFLADIWNDNEGGLVTNLNRDYTNNSVRVALHNLRAAIRLADKAGSSTKQKGLTLSFTKPIAHPGPGGADNLPDPYYSVRQVRNNVQYDVGSRVDPAQAALLVEEPDWDITFI